MGLQERLQGARFTQGAAAAATRPHRLSALPRTVMVIGLVVAALAALRFAASWAVVLDPGGREWGEGLTLDHARRLLRGEPLYQPFGTSFLAIAGYTPLYYYVLAGLEAVLGASLGYLPGRLVTMAATGVAMALVWRAAERRTGDWRAGALGALLLLAVGMPSHPAHPQSALQKEAVPALAFALSAVALLDVSRITMRHALLAGLLVSLAILTKQTMAILALALAVYLWLDSRRLALMFSAVVGVVGGGVCMAFELLGGNFFAGTIGSTVNPFSVQVLLGYLPVLILLIGGIGLSAAVYLWFLARHQRAKLHDPWVFAWIAGLVLLATTLPKLGTNPSHWLLFSATSTALIPVMLWQFLRKDASVGPKQRRLATGLLLFNLLCAVPFAWQTAGAAKELIRPSATYRAEFGELLQLVAATPSDVLADPQDVIPLAGRQIITEPWGMSLAHHVQPIGWQAQPVVEAICSGRFGRLVLEYELSTGGPHEFIPRWPPMVLDALQQTMVLETQLAKRYVYRWSRPCVA